MPDFSDYTEEEKSAASIKAANMMRVVRANARAADGRDMQAYDAFRIVAVDAILACDRKDAELLRLREMLREYSGVLGKLDQVLPDNHPLVVRAEELIGTEGDYTPSGNQIQRELVRQAEWLLACARPREGMTHVEFSQWEMQYRTWLKKANALCK